MKNKIAAYGTLRKGFYNFNRFPLKFVKTITIKGYDLYDLGPYPMAIESDNEIVVDIIECDDYTKKIIDQMEIGAGYTPKKILVENEECTIYLFNKPTGTKINNGDYVQYKNILRQ